VTVDADAELSVVATPTQVRVASVAIDVSGRAVNFDPVDLGVDDVDEDIEDRVVEGSFVLHVTNPFGVSADFDLSIAAPGITPINRSAVITSAATSEVRIDFTGAELRSFLGEQDVLLTGTAVVDAAAGVVTVLPGQELILEANMDLTLEIGGGSD
jgi:hypothetical protein